MPAHEGRPYANGPDATRRIRNIRPLRLGIARAGNRPYLVDGSTGRLVTTHAANRSPPGMPRFAAFKAFALLFAALAPAAALAAIPVDHSHQMPTRGDEPALVPGTALGDFRGAPIAELFVFAFDPALGYVPIPFQIDERLQAVFNEGTPYAFTELMYDVEHREDGTLDDDDELAFLFADARADRAPADQPWPEGATGESYEVEVIDTRPGTPAGNRYVYVFRGTGLAVSPVRYVDWDLGDLSPIDSGLFELGFAGRWTVDVLRVLPPCGDGSDLIDRIKGRARPRANLWEDEEGWSFNSTYLGGLVGPVRAIRYVRGATSGLNTIHHDLVYRGLWLRTINLRVHPVEEVLMYFDWRPGPNEVLFLPSVRMGLRVDGLPDPSAGTTFASWAILRSPKGGGGVLFDVPPSPKYRSRELFHVDDATVDDRIPTNLQYGDEDNAAYGDVGMRLLGLADSNVDPIVMRLQWHPLCADEGNATTGDALLESRVYPLTAQAAPRQPGDLRVTALRIARLAEGVELTWPALGGATSYRVYAAADPALPHEQWALAGETIEPRLVDPDPSGALRCWSVTSVAGGIEGPW